MNAPAISTAVADAAWAALDDWLAAHADEQVEFLQALVRVPTDTPPGDNAPHAELTARWLQGMGLVVERHPVPAAMVQAQGLQSITNLIVRQQFGAGAGAGDGPTIALNAHGDVVPPGEGWTHDPYGAEVVDGRLYGRAAAVSKSDFATYTYALRALQALGVAQGQAQAGAQEPPQGSDQAQALSRVASPAPVPAQALLPGPPGGFSLHGSVELHFTYDEEFGGELGPGWLLAQGLTRPDLLIAAGFSHEVVTAHNGCLQMEVTLLGLASHAAYPETGVDALQAATALLRALYAHNAELRERASSVAGIRHPYLNVGRIDGGTHTNVVPGRVLLKLDRRMVPEEDPATVEAEVRALITTAVSAADPRVRVQMRRLLLARPLQPLAGNAALVAAVQRHGLAVFGHDIPQRGTPLYTDVRLYGERDIPAVIYGAGPSTVLQSNAKRADEHLMLSDLRGATRVVARSLFDLLAVPA